MVERVFLMASLTGIQDLVTREAAWKTVEIFGGSEALLCRRNREISLHFSEDGGFTGGSENKMNRMIVGASSFKLFAAHTIALTSA